MAQQVTAGRRYLRAFVSGFFVAVPVTVTVLDRVACVARVEGASMQPFLNPEGGSGCDVVLLNRWTVRNYQVQRGDVVSIMFESAVRRQRPHHSVQQPHLHLLTFLFSRAGNEEFTSAYSEDLWPRQMLISQYIMRCSTMKCRGLITGVYLLHIEM
uniref:Inner mitochondrial membrane peptidase subunit 2 n=1 Tax=Mastacembelus armatus TaxID=205130 RepID=A0A3Q3M670_9TELE